jgi:hypothetical protein
MVRLLGQRYDGKPNVDIQIAAVWPDNFMRQTHY